MSMSTSYEIMNQNLHSVCHPLVSDMYVKREFSANHPGMSEDVLIIEANFSEKEMDHSLYSSMMSDLFLALPDIRDQVESSVGAIDRIDIKTH